MNMKQNFPSFTDPNVYSGLPSEMSAAPPPDPNVYCSAPFTQKPSNFAANYVPPQQQPLPSFLSGNLGALAPPSDASMFSGPDVSETLFNVATDANKPQIEPTLLLVERIKVLCKILAKNEEASTLQNFLISTFNRQAYKSNLTGADTFFSAIARFIPQLTALDPQKAANELRKQLSKNVVENKDFSEVNAIVIH